MLKSHNVLLELDRITGLAQSTGQCNYGMCKENLHFDNQNKHITYNKLFSLNLFLPVLSKRNREH